MYMFKIIFNKSFRSSLVGEDVPKLEYNLSVGFKLLNLHGFKQRNVLMVWRSVRNLEKAFQKVSADDINRGVIFINNTMVGLTLHT